MSDISIVFNENINGKLCPETITFPMVFKADNPNKFKVGQHFDFWFSPERIDRNGIKSYSEKQFLFKALIYDFYQEQMFKMPEHMFFLYWGKPKTETMEIICQRLKIAIDTQVIMAFFTKDLSTKNPSYE